MLYKFFRSILFLFDPEYIHDLILSLLSCPWVQYILAFWYREHIPQLERKFFGVAFKNPIGLAAGFDKNAKALLAWQALGFGFVEVGTVTPRPQSGNPKPRILRFKKEKALVNWMGFNNDGVECVLERIQKAKPKLTIPIGLNIGKNKETPLEKAVGDYVYCIEKANPIVDFFVINISSPNTPELRQLQGAQYLRNILSELKKITTRPIWVKLSPDLSETELRNVLTVITEVKISGVVATNTTIDYELLPGKNLVQGGISGEPLREKSLALLKRLKTLSKDLIIIGVGGIFSERDALQKMNAGADLIELYTGFIFQGPSLVSRINRSNKKP